MFEILRYGEMLLNMLNEVGDWLVHTPEVLQLPVMVAGQFSGEYFSVPWPFGNIASLIFGGGLIFMLGYRLVKFFTDILL